jgi:DNA ligase 3
MQPILIRALAHSCQSVLFCVCISAGYQGDTFLLLKLLLPGVIKAVYNLNNKQIVKLFSLIFDTDLDEMIEDLEQGDVAETVALFFEKSKKCPPQKKGTLSIQEVSHF